MHGQDRYDTSAHCGDIMIYGTWASAKAAYDIMYKNEPEIRRCMRIYPVVAVAGNEPRTTKPLRD